MTARPRFEIFACRNPGHSSQTIAEALPQAFLATVIRAAHRDPCQTDPTAPSDDASNGHGTGQVIFTGHEQQMMHSKVAEGAVDKSGSDSLVHAREKL